MPDNLPVPPAADDDRYALRLKRQMAEAHLRLSDAGVHQAALTVLAQIMVNKDDQGQALQADLRTRVQAARALLRSAAEFALDRTSVGGGPMAIQINITQGGTNADAKRIAPRDTEGLG